MSTFIYWPEGQNVFMYYIISSSVCCDNPQLIFVFDAKPLKIFLNLSLPSGHETRVCLCCLKSSVCLLSLCLNVFVCDERGAAGVTHVSRRQPQVEGAAVFLAALNGQNSNCRQPLAHHQPAQHAHALKHRKQQATQATAAVMMRVDLW